MARQITLLEAHYMPQSDSVFVTFPDPDGSDLPAGHSAPQLAFVMRAALYGMDVTHPRFHLDALTWLLHEARTPAGVHPHGHPQAGQVHDFAAANAHTRWVIPPHLHTAIRRIEVRPEQVTGARIALISDPLPPLPQAERMLTPGAQRVPR